MRTSSLQMQNPQKARTVRNNEQDFPMLTRQRGKIPIKFHLVVVFHHPPIVHAHIYTLYRVAKFSKREEKRKDKAEEGSSPMIPPRKKKIPSQKTQPQKNAKS